jgi:hypothetical protein|tara:strand:- start:1330 stop:1833 length:504 start_codon:yes stop_codon:yes gene_type:complete
MASTVKTDFTLTLKAKEEESNDLGTSRMTHNLAVSSFFAAGSTASKFDRVYSDSGSAAGSAVAIDVLGGLSSVLTGDAGSFVTLNGILIRNKSTTSTEILSIGGGSNPIVGCWGATGDLIKLGPGGTFVWLDPVDGVTPVAGTGDILTLDPGSDTISYDVVLLGRSA